MNLGEFGTPPPPAEPVEITYFNETIRANPELGELDYVDFMSTAGGVDVTNPLAAGLIKDFARLCIHGEDFDTFWSLARKNRQGVEDLFPLLQRIVEKVTERPTGRPSDSSDGPSTTPQSSEDADFSRAMQEYSGRPDLQLAIVRADEDRRTA